MTGRRAVGIGAIALSGAVAAVWIVVALLFDGYQIPSEANAPTLQPGDRVLTRSVSDGDLRRGDLVVVARPPRETGVLDGDGAIEVVGRVVALGGDEVGAEDGVLVVDGEPVDEPYLPEGTTTDGFDPVDVPDGHVFLLCDARARAADSRAFGPVPVDDIRSRVVARWWPLTRIGGI